MWSAGSVSLALLFFCVAEFVLFSLSLSYLQVGECQKEGSGSSKQGSQGRGDLWVHSQGDRKGGRGKEEAEEEEEWREQECRKGESGGGGGWKALRGRIPTTRQSSPPITSLSLSEEIQQVIDQTHDLLDGDEEKKEDRKETRCGGKA